MTVRAALALLIALCACGCGSPAGVSDASCAATFRSGGRLYRGLGTEGLPLRLPPPSGRRTVELPPCNDTGGNDTATHTTTVYTYGRIPASVLLGDGERRPHTVFLTSDSLIATRSHPAHGLFYEDGATPDHRRGRCRPRPPVTAHLRGDARGSFADVLVVGDRGFWVDATTRLRGPVVDGVARLPSRARVRVTAERCGRSRRDTALTVTVL